MEKLILFVILNFIWGCMSAKNLVFIIADDLGLTDAGFRSNNQIKTPNLDGFAQNGINLDNYYVMPVCSPTRASIMTGRYPLRFGLQDYVILPRSPFGLHLNETTLVRLLKDSGYQTHAVGKWHLGHDNWAHTPTFRGFDTFYGFYTGGEYYYTHLNEGSYDFRYDKEPNCGVNCTHILYEDIDKYSTEIFSQRAVDIINNHDKSKPLYLYLAYQAVHSPSEVPDRYVQPYKDTIQNDKRRKFAGMLSCMDEGIGNITQALKDRGMMDDTYIIFTGDNGGPIWEANCSICGDYIGSNNFPFRGGKHSFYEGGIRAIAMINGPNLPKITYNGLLHSVDWLPTICNMLNISYEGKTLPLDGLNQWEKIINNQVSKRTNITINIEMSNPEGPRAAYINGNYKILVGPCGPPYSTVPTPNLNSLIDPNPKQIIHQVYKYDPSQEIKDLLKAMKFPETSRLELYNILDDPYETKNIIETNEKIAVELLTAILEESHHMFPAYDPYYKDPRAEKARVNNTWYPWNEDSS